MLFFQIIDSCKTNKHVHPPVAFTFFHKYFMFFSYFSLQMPAIYRMPGCFIIYIMVMELISEAMGNVKKKKQAFIYFDHYQRFSTAICDFLQVAGGFDQVINRLEIKNQCILLIIILSPLIKQSSVWLPHYRWIQSFNSLQ